MMDDFNPYAAPVAPLAPPPESDAPQTDPMSVKQGAWIWFKWSSILSVPIVVLLLFVVCGVLLYEVLKGRRAASQFDRRFWVLILSPFVFYLCTCLWGVVIGVLLASVGHLVRADSRRNRT